MSTIDIQAKALADLNDYQYWAEIQDLKLSVVPHYREDFTDDEGVEYPGEWERGVFLTDGQKYSGCVIGRLDDPPPPARAIWPRLAFAMKVNENHPIGAALGPMFDRVKDNLTRNRRHDRSTP